MQLKMRKYFFFSKWIFSKKLKSKGFLWSFNEKNFRIEINSLFISTTHSKFIKYTKLIGTCANLPEKNNISFLCARILSNFIQRDFSLNCPIVNHGGVSFKGVGLNCKKVFDIVLCYYNIIYNWISFLCSRILRDFIQADSSYRCS